MKRKTVAIIGYGYVGKAMRKLYETHHDVIWYDVNVPVNEALHKEEMNKADLVVVCVPTPKGDNGECDLSAIYDTFKWLTVKNVIIKSTVEVGTTKKLQLLYPGLNIVFCPEFAGESTYWSSHKFHHDVKETPHFIFGGINPGPIIDFYIPILGPEKEYIITDSTTAEMTKYVVNCFFATKVAFCNEIYDICQAVGLDYHKVRELWLKDPRVSKMHTLVFPDNRGFGGKCLPKDISALIELSKKYKVNPQVMESVQEYNKSLGN